MSGKAYACDQEPTATPPALMMRVPPERALPHIMNENQMLMYWHTTKRIMHSYPDVYLRQTSPQIFLVSLSSFSQYAGLPLQEYLINQIHVFTKEASSPQPHRRSASLSMKFCRSSESLRSGVSPSGTLMAFSTHPTQDRSCRQACVHLCYTGLWLSSSRWHCSKVSNENAYTCV